MIYYACLITQEQSVACELQFGLSKGLNLLKLTIDENGEIVIGDFEGVKKGINKVYIIKPVN